MDRVVGLANASIVALWVVWLAGWTAAAFFVKRVQRRERVSAILLERVPVMIGFLMLVLPNRLPFALTRRFLHETPSLALAALAAVAVGLGIAVWARLHLGRNWSGQVIVRMGHSLVTSGPYRRVRHPIYAGMTVALAGTALAIGAPYAFVALGLILFGFLVRVRLEEALMRETFPNDYDAYRRRTARLIPGVF